MRRCLLSTIFFLSAVLSSAFAGGGSDDLPKWKPDANADRVAIPEIYRWQLTRLLPDEAAWETSLVELGKRVPELEAYRGKLADPRALRDALDLYFELHGSINRLTPSASLLLDTAQASAKYQGMSKRALALMDELMMQASVIRSEALALSEEMLAKAYAAEAFARIGIDGVQLHGGVGYTDEYDIQLYLKRSKWVRPIFGDAAYHYERIANLGGL